MHRLPPAIRKARKSFTIFLVAVVLFLVLDVWQVLFSGSNFLPKLALDLEGGTQIILQAKVAYDREITSEQMQQAVAVIRNRVDATGISEAEVSIQGSTNIAVAIPGTPSQEIYDRIRSSSKMDMRPVLLTKAVQPPVPDEASKGGEDSKEGSAKKSDSKTDKSEGKTTGKKGDKTGDKGAGKSDSDLKSNKNNELSATVSVTDVNSQDGSTSSRNTSHDATTKSTKETGKTDKKKRDRRDKLGKTGENKPKTPRPQPKTPTDLVPSPRPKTPSDSAWITQYWRDYFESYECGGDSGEVPQEDLPIIACDQYGLTKYLLGPVDVSGTDISRAVASPVSGRVGGVTIGWGVVITFNAEGAEKFKETSTRLISLPSPRNQFAAVLDGVVITAPEVKGVTGNPQITGNFNQESANYLANQLNFGSLPVSFEVQSSENVSATLGSNQLRSGILAGILGMILVVIYSLLQYRLLGLLTVSSLVCSALVTYLVITFLSWQSGYRLSLAGVAGLIVSIGITADSFIVYFERVKDELREGRDIILAVDRGWSRAFRTICASDAVNFLAAIVLFLVAVGSVKGFAFTLGLTTLVDLLVVVFFTHPVLQYLSHTNFFSRKASGLNVKSSVYRGRFRIRDKSHKTIAERKAGE